MPPPASTWAGAWSSPLRARATTCSLRGSPRKTMPNALVKHATARPPMSARPAINASNGTAIASAGRNATFERTKENQKFAHETVQRRQTRNRDRADKKSRRRPRHPFQQPAELVNFTRSSAMHHRARAEEQQSLEQRMIEHVQQRAAKARARPAPANPCSCPADRRPGPAR